MKKLFLLLAIAGFFVACAPKAAEEAPEAEAVEEVVVDAEEDTEEVVVEDVEVEDAE